MSASITATGTFSGLTIPPTNEGQTIRQQTAENKFSHHTNIQTDVQGFPETMQFVGLFAEAYGLDGMEAVWRIREILNAVEKQPALEAGARQFGF